MSRLRLRANNLMLQGAVGGGTVGPVSVVCPAITPTLGDELITNGTFDTDIASWDNISTGTGSVAWVNDGNPAGACDLTRVNTGNRGIIQQVIAFASHTLCRFSAQPETATNCNVGSASGGTQFWAHQSATLASIIVNSNPAYVSFSGAVDGITGWVDNVSLKELVQASCMSDILITGSSKDNTVICTPTVGAQGNFVGVIYNYYDEDNFVLAVVDNFRGARLYKKLGGLWSQVITGTVTYGAGFPLKIVSLGGNYSLYYNNIQVGTAQAIVETTLGTIVRGFNTHASNSVGTVTAGGS